MVLFLPPRSSKAVDVHFEEDWLEQVARDQHMNVFELGIRRFEYDILACDLRYLHASAIHRLLFNWRTASDWCRRNLCWNCFWRDLQRDEVTRSCGEVNRLIGRPFVETSLAVHLAHCDLTGSRQSPK
jgi:hypothetical protein